MTAPYGTVENPDQLEFSFQFKTSANDLLLLGTIPGAGKTEIPVKTNVELSFNSPIQQGPSFDAVTIKDSNGTAIEFTGQGVDHQAILTPVYPLKPFEYYTVTIPEGAFQGDGETKNDSYQFSFRTVSKINISPNMIQIPEVGFAGKHSILSAAEAVNTAKNHGRYFTSIRWSIDGQEISAQASFYHLFLTAGTYQVDLTLTDNKGYSYEFSKDIEIQDLTEIKMSFADSDHGLLRKVIAVPSGERYSLDYELKLVQSGQLINGERISADLYKNGVWQRSIKGPDYEYLNTIYKFTFKPQPGEYGIYELVFSYEGTGKKQVLCVPVEILTAVRYTTNEFNFRLFDYNTNAWHEAPESLDVFLNDQKFRAVKKWYDDKMHYAYTITQMVDANLYYAFEAEAWDKAYRNQTVYVAKEPSEPVVIYGRTIVPGGVKRVTINTSESTVKEPFTQLFFEGVSARLVLDVQGDWKDLDPGYYEIQTWPDERYNLKVKCGNKDEVQKITLDPGLQLKAGEQLVIRMVTKQGAVSGWNYCPYINVIPIPSLLGKELSISLQNGEYAVNWPTVFSGFMGGSIGALDDIPVVSDGNFGLGSGMPKFEGLLEGNDSWPEVNLRFGAVAGYGALNMTAADSKKHKKLKKVTAVGYELEIAVEGGMELIYDAKDEEWSLHNFFIILLGDASREWSKGYEFMGVGFTAGVGIGAEVYGGLRIDREKSGTQYSGIIGLTPYTWLRVSGDFKLARVDGYLNGWFPAEIHFPTGYIGADIRLSARIDARALLWGKTIYQKRIWGVHWDNGKEKVVLDSMQDQMKAFAADENEPVELLSREYASRQPAWLAGNAVVNPDQATRILAYLNGPELRGEEDLNPSVGVMLENVYPNAEVQLVRNGDELWLVWSDDNPSRDAVSRTQLRYSVLKDGMWSEPVWVGDDGTADFDPAVAAAGNGVLMAWHNIGTAVTEEDGLAGMLENSEISVTENIFAADAASPNIITLTHDDAIDHSPRLAAQDDKALLVWTKSQSLGFSLEDEATQDAQSGDQLFFSAWNNGTWSAPEPLGDASSTVIDSSLAMADGNGLLLFTVDFDNDLTTGEDREVFARLYNGNAWGEAIRLTNNAHGDFAPRAVHVNGQWFITWVQDGKLAYQTGLDGETKTEERLSGLQGDYQLTAQSDAGSLISLVTLVPGEDKAVGVTASFYDVENKQWGNPVSLTASPDEHTKAISAMLTEDGKLNVAFSQAEIVQEAIPGIIDGEERLVEQPVVTDKADLKLLTYQPVHDMAISEEEGISLSTEFPLPNTVVTANVVLRNEGDFSENVRVLLYDGDPDTGGEFIGEAPLQLLPARSSSETQLDWLVGPEEKNTYHLYAVVQSAEGVQEIDTENNTINLEFSTADISITSLNCVNVGKDDYLITVTVANSGSKLLEETSVRIENVSDGVVLETIPVEAMEPGRKIILTKLISAVGLTEDDNGHINLRIHVNPPEGVREDFTGNNSRSFTLEPAVLTVNSLKPGSGDKHVDPASPLSIVFNMPVSEGIGYENILLLDQNLNEVALNKVLAGSTLTITPRQVLNQNTKYTLVIPADALRDAYGHAMKKDFSFSFTTLSSYPEIVSAYPGAFMENAAVNTDIRLKFNQNVSRGIDFSQISLFGPEADRVPVTATLEGEFLLLNYTGRLAEKSLYSLEVPMRAVQNDEQETMIEDYILAFTTGNQVQENDGPDDEDNNDDDTSFPDNPKADDIQAGVESGGTKRTVKISTEAGKAVIKLENTAIEGLKGSTNAVVDIPAVPGANSYTLEMPAEFLAAGGVSFTVNTALGSVELPSGMISEELGGKTFGLTIATVDKASLPADVGTAIGDRPVLQIAVTIDGEETAWNNPDTPIRVKIPYTPTAEELESPESIIIWYVDAKGNLITVPNGAYDPLTGTVSFTTTHLSNFAVAYNRVSFQDVAENAWYNSAVSFIAARGITKGTGKELFSPDNRLTRAEVITMVMRAYGIEPDTRFEDNFTDAGNTWYTGYLAAAKRLGISKGVGNNRFAPDNEITRQEMFTLFYNALKVIRQLPKTKESNTVPGRKLSDFTDGEQIASWATEAMTLLVETGTINGNAGKLAPGDTSTRAEMAQVLYNLMTR